MPDAGGGHVPTLCRPAGTSLPLPNFLCKSMNQKARPRGAFWGAEHPQQVPAPTRTQGTGTLGDTVLPSPGEGFPPQGLRAGRRCTSHGQDGLVYWGQLLSAQTALGRAKWIWVCRYLRRQSEGNVNTDGVEMPRHRDILTGGSPRWAAAPGDPPSPCPAWGWSWVSQPRESRGAALGWRRALPCGIHADGEMMDGARQKPPVPAAHHAEVYPPLGLFSSCLQQTLL